MPTQLGRVTVETPQEVLARLQQERRAMSASGNVSAVNQATVSNALDSLFGNPEVKAAKALQDRITNAQASVQAQEGEDDVTTEMRRISSIRAAVQDIDPNLANEMTTQLLQLGTIRAERQKLLAQQQLAVGRDVRGNVKLESDLATARLTQEEKLAGLQASAGKGINFWRRRGGRIEHIALPEQSFVERRRLLTEGWLEGTGPTTEAEASSIVNPTKPVETDLQTQFLNATAQLDAMASIGQKFEAGFLTLPNRIMMKGVEAADALGIGGVVPVDLMGKFERYTEFRANSIEAFNQYIKSITGAAMAVAEAQRIQKSFIDAENDSPHEFLSKMRVNAKQLLGIQKRAAQALQEGIPLTPTKLAAMPIPTASDAEVDTFLSRFGIPARISAAQRSGAVSTPTGGSTTAGVSTRQQRIDAILNGGN